MRKTWNIIPQNSFLSQHLAQVLKTSPVFAQILINRGLLEEEKARLFLRAKLTQLHNPWLFRDMDRALDLITEAVKSKNSILIYGDYDVDGITGTALLYRLLKNLGANVNFYIPHRIKEGYGLNKEALRRAVYSGVKLIITCDCGTNDRDVLNFAEKSDLDIIITDHHEVHIEPFSKIPLINPKRKDSIYPYPDLAGVGVVFKLVQALLERFDFPDKERWEIEHLDLVALGTIADAVPLTGENRIIVKHGLKRLSKSNNPGIIALKEAAGLKPDELDYKKVSFILAPRINAAGRIKDGTLGVELLTADSALEAARLAEEMNSLNQERQNIQELVFKEALDKIDNEIDLENDKVILLCSQKWHLGVIGIVASRIAEKFSRPVFLLSQDSVSRGSARSVDGFPLHKVLAECKDYLINYGGHEYAAGLTISEEKIPLLHERLKELGEKFLPDLNFSYPLEIDGEISLEEITPILLDHLKFLAPFGQGNPPPLFLTRNLQLDDFPRVVGRNHLKFMVREKNNLREVIGFGFGDRLPQLMPANKKIDIVYSPEINEWQGESFIQLNLKDIEISGD